MKRDATACRLSNRAVNARTFSALFTQPPTLHMDPQLLERVDALGGYL